MKRLLIFLLIVVMLSLLLSGCVAKSDYDDLQVKYDILRSKLMTIEGDLASLNRSHTALDSQYQDLNTEHKFLKKDFEKVALYLALEQIHNYCERDMLTMSQASLTIDALVTKLENPSLTTSWKRTYYYVGGGSPKYAIDYYALGFWTTFFQEMDGVLKEVATEYGIFAW